MAKTAKALVPIILILMLTTVGCSSRKPPIITSISPNSGQSGGGTQFTITGENFKEGATLTIGGKPVSITINPEGTSVRGTTPGGPPGSAQVVARNPKAEDPSVATTFNYVGIKVVSTTPADGTQLPWYPRSYQASATLSQDIQAGSGSISIDGVEGEVSHDMPNKTINFAAVEPLPTGETFTATVSGVKDKAGNTMPDYSFSFSIEEAVKVVWYTVQEGDTLPIIAAKPEVYEDESRWKDILAVNQDEFMTADGENGNDIILDSMDLKPGMEIYIPRP
jgi:nucleoid-associated protein YgaU